MVHEHQLLADLTDLTGRDWSDKRAGFKGQAEEFLTTLHAEGEISTEVLLTLCQRAPIEVDIARRAGKEGYAELGLVGMGAMGEVHLVRDWGLLRRVARKRLLPDAAANQAVVGRFLNEARLTAGLNHPNIVPIYSLDQEAGGPAYTMKLVQGSSLKQLIQASRESGTYDRQDLLEIFLSVCEAMDYAHRQGVIHRDLKPANIMIGPYREVYVLDWGIARRIGSGSEPAGDAASLEGLALDLTQAGEIPGTPRYMSPEQIKKPHSALDGRSDLFSLGAILFELLTLRQAFQGSSVTEVLKHILTGRFAAWKPAPETVPVELRAICAKALAVKPEARYADVGALAADLRAWNRGEAIAARPDTFWTKLLRGVRRHQNLLLGLMLILMLISAGVLVLNLYREGQQLRAARAREARLNALLGQVASQSQAFDKQLLEIELSLQEFTAVIAAYLTRFPESERRYYYHQRLNPPDLAYSRLYGVQLSAEWPIGVPTHGVKEDGLKHRLRQLSPLQDYFRRLFLRNAEAPQPITDPRLRRELVADKGQNITYMTTILAEDFAFWYPGVDIDSRIDDYDVKKRDYYNTIGKYGFQWGTPQVESSTLKLAIPVATAVYDPRQKFIASTVFATIVDQIVSRHLDVSGQPAIRQAYLLDKQGNVLVSSEKTGEHFSSRKFLTAIETKPFPQAEVVAKVRQGQTGYSIYTDAQGRQMVTVFYRLRTLDWFFAVTADLQALLNTAQ